VAKDIACELIRQDKVKFTDIPALSAAIAYQIIQECNGYNNK
jgi:hypothetical protein